VRRVNPSSRQEGRWDKVEQALNLWKSDILFFFFCCKALDGEIRDVFVFLFFGHLPYCMCGVGGGEIVIVDCVFV
jgi:hypothetical protein